MNIDAIATEHLISYHHFFKTAVTLKPRLVSKDVLHSRKKCEVLLHTSLHTSVDLSLFHGSVKFNHKKCGVFFIPHSMCTITTHLCHYKLSYCLPTCLSYSPFECLPACRSDWLSLCLWSVPLVVCLCVFLFVCLPVAYLPVCLSVCFSACISTSVCLPVFASSYLSFCEFVFLYVCPPACLLFVYFW